MAMDNTSNCYFKRIEDNVVWTKLDQTAMIILTRENEEKVFNLNKTAAYLWEKCDGTKTLEELIKELCEHYNVDEATARKDAEAFIAKMKDSQLLAISSVAG
jgi:methyltransferase-like protein